MTPILAAYDGSRQSVRAFEMALEFARWKSLDLVVLAVIQIPELHEPEERQRIVSIRRKELEQGQRELKNRFEPAPVSIEWEIHEGHPVDTILERIERLKSPHIFLGHRGRKGIFQQLLMGSVSKRIADFAPCTVTIVR